MADVGLRMLGNLYSQLMIDDAWCVRRERGFTWWSYRLAQHIEVSQPFQSHGVEVCTVRIWTETVGDVDPRTSPAIVIAPFNMHATSDALVWSPNTSMISRCSSAVVHDETIGWMSKILATAAVVQNAGAHNQAHDLARACGGQPAASNHPSNGRRDERDDILNMPSHVLVPEGGYPSRFTGPGMANASDFLVQMNFLGSADATGLTCEVPFTRNEPMAVTSMAGGDQLHTSLVQIFTDVAHPEAGNGLFTLMKLPVSPNPQDIPSIANALNAAEAGGLSLSHLLGAWCPDPTSDRTLAFCSFVPNMLSHLVRVENIVWDQSVRSQFARSWFGSNAN